MHVSQARALELAHRETVRPEVWERRLQRFPEPWRHRVRAVANEHPRLRDLARSFPALLFAIAAPRAGVDARAVKTAVILGARLKDAAALAQVPMWLRGIPPEAFARPLPVMPNSEIFRVHTANYVPRSPKRLPDWLDAVANANIWADERLAIWAAQQLHRGSPGPQINRLRRICIWAWYSLNVTSEGLRRAETPWEPSMGFSTALIATNAWFDNVRLYLSVGEVPIADTWASDGSCDGLTFKALRTATEIAEEAAAMRNCLRTYAMQVARNQSRLFSVRRAGERVATLELAQRYPDPLPRPVQLRLFENKDAPPEIWSAARRWLEAQNLHADTKPRPRNETVMHRQAWLAFWRPYWIAKRRIPEWLPLSPPSFGMRNI